MAGPQQREIGSPNSEQQCKLAGAPTSEAGEKSAYKNIIGGAPT
ncbi:hypothetical protein ACVQ90_05800 [Staphylococcus aureus]